MDRIISLKNIHKSYFSNKNEAPVLFGIDLDFEKGSFNSIIGQSGSGKSTLLNIISTLDQPTKGNVFYGDINTTDMEPTKIAKLRNEMIGFVFQFHYLLPEFTVLENVLMPSWVRGVDNQEKLDRAMELIELVGLTPQANNMSTDISGGQQQRTAIARALMNNPKVILADEPTGNLDSTLSRTIYEMFRDINKRLGTTFIVITHDERIANEADRIIEIKDGRVSRDENN